MEKTYEVCPHCGNEVELDAELKVQTCPSCGKRIVTCSMCRAVDDANFSKACTCCCLEYQANIENLENSRKISIPNAEKKVRELAENESIEDRVYEMGQSLVDGYINSIVAEKTVIDSDGNPCTGEDADGSMWYDEVREDAKKIIFEKIADFFTKKA